MKQSIAIPATAELAELFNDFKSRRFLKVFIHGEEVEN